MMRSSEIGPELYAYVRDGYNRQCADVAEQLEDFYSGAGFRKYGEWLEGFRVEVSTSKYYVLQIFIFVSTDGASACKSSSKNFWPGIVYVGIVPPDRRYQEQHILPVMCIPGNSADLESFLNPLFSEIEGIGEGFDCSLWDGHPAKVYVHLMHVLADLPAKRNLFLIKGGNGYCPFLYCKVRGGRSPKNGKIYYPNYVVTEKRKRNGRERSSVRTVWRPDNLPTRTEVDSRQTFRAIADLMANNDVANCRKLQQSSGIIAEPQLIRRFKSITPFLSLPIDLMHLLFENIAPQIVSIWTTDIDTHEKHCYMKSPSTLRSVDNTLRLAGSGIDESLRRPRELLVKARWKADEWRTFVVTTSMATLHQFLPEKVMDGWWMFCQICELSIRPILSQADIDELAGLCLSFFPHYSEIYYGGDVNNVHLMKYTIHLVLHIAASSHFCEPLACLSEFPTERYIGITKESTKARHRYAESVAARWTFVQSIRMCQLATAVSVRLIGKQRSTRKLDVRSALSNIGLYRGFVLKGPSCMTTINAITEKEGFHLGSRLERYYAVEFGLSLQQIRNMFMKYPHVSRWDRLIVGRPTDLVSRNYAKYINDPGRRSCSFFAAEFEGPEGAVADIEVFYGRVFGFLEHSFLVPTDSRRESRIIVVADWASRSRLLAKQQRIIAKGSKDSVHVFSVRTVEEVQCISRNIAVIEVEDERRMWKHIRTHFVDDRTAADALLTITNNTDGVNKRLCGFKTA